MLVSIAEIIFHFNCSHEQFYMRYCVSNVSLHHPAPKDFIGIIPSSIPVFLHFMLASIAEIVFHFNCSHEQFHIGYCVWIASLLHLARKDFIGLIPSFILVLLHFILVSIAEIIFHFHGNEQFHVGYCVWNVSLHHLARKGFIGPIPSSISAFLYFIHAVIIFHFHSSHEQFHIGYCFWNISLLHSTHKDFISLIPSSILAFLHFMSVSIAEIIFIFIGFLPSSILAFLHFTLASIVVIIFDFDGSHEQFHKGYCVWNVSLLNLAHKDFIDLILSSIPGFLHFILTSIAKIIFHFHGSHGQFHIGYCVWNVSLLNPAHKDFIDLILSSIPGFLHFILASIAKFISNFRDSHEQFHIG